MSKRQISALLVPGVVPATIEGGEPIFRWVDPRGLMVDESYQRGLSERSIALIRKVVGGWSWTKFKPPIVVETDDGLEVVDGQHTAISAASHPEIKKIPVMVVEADTIQQRADAFLGHNADRIAVTPLQMFHAAVLAGDETAIDMASACERAGVRVLKSVRAADQCKPGDTLAVSTIKALVKRRYVAGARRVLQVCADAKRAPIGAADLRGVEELIFGEEWKGKMEDSDITTAMIKHGLTLTQRAKAHASANDVPAWRSVTAILGREARK